jgi:hypothetical protein
MSRNTAMKVSWSKGRATVLDPRPCYQGVSLSFRFGGEDIVLIGKNIESLRNVWKSLAGIDVEEDLLKEVVIFAKEHCREGRKP